MANELEEEADESLTSFLRDSAPCRAMAEDGGIEGLWDMAWSPMHQTTHFSGMTVPDDLAGSFLAPAFGQAPLMLDISMLSLAVIASRTESVTGRRLPERIGSELLRAQKATIDLGPQEDERLQFMTAEYLAEFDPVRCRRRSRE